MKVSDHTGQPEVLDDGGLSELLGRRYAEERLLRAKQIGVKGGLVSRHNNDGQRSSSGNPDDTVETALGMAQQHHRRHADTAPDLPDAPPPTA